MAALRVAGVLLAVAVLAATVGPAAATPVRPSPTERQATGAQPPGGGSCFPGSGHRFEMGRYGPSMVVVVHTSLFPNVLGSDVDPDSVANGSVDVRNATGVDGVENATGGDGGSEDPIQPARPTAEGALGIEAQGVAMEQRIVFLRTGVIYTGTDGALEFLSNPFEPFALVFNYRFSLPMFDPFGVDANYESDESPVEGIETVPC